jgi:hypothetical protein
MQISMNIILEIEMVDTLKYIGTALYKSKPSFKGAKFMENFPQYVRDCFSRKLKKKSWEVSESYVRIL